MAGPCRPRAAFGLERGQSRRGQKPGSCGRPRSPPGWSSIPRCGRAAPPGGSGPGPGRWPGTRPPRPPAAPILSSAAGGPSRRTRPDQGRLARPRPARPVPRPSWPRRGRGGRAERLPGHRHARAGPDGRRGQPGGHQPVRRAAQGLAVPASGQPRPAGRGGRAAAAPGPAGCPLAARAARLGFPDVPSYLCDRHVQQHWTAMPSRRKRAVAPRRPGRAAPARAGLEAHTANGTAPGNAPRRWPPAWASTRWRLRRPAPGGRLDVAGDVGRIRAAGVVAAAAGRR